MDTCEFQLKVARAQGYRRPTAEQLNQMEELAQAETVVDPTLIAEVRDYWRCPRCDERRMDHLAALDCGAPAKKLSEAPRYNADHVWVQCLRCGHQYLMGDGEVCDLCTRACIVDDNALGACQHEP